MSVVPLCVTRFQYLRQRQQIPEKEARLIIMQVRDRFPAHCPAPVSPASPPSWERSG